MKKNEILKLIIAVVVSELAGIIGSVFTTPSIAGWYAGLTKPSFNPPAWVFAPVWTTLFALMGIAAFLIWRQGLNRRDVKIALGVFVLQLILNTLWSIIFFGWHNPGGAFVEIIFLWFSILAAIILFYRVSKPAAWLLLPYILWVSFAGFLNYSLWQLNKNEQALVPCTMEAKLCPDGSYVGRTGPKCEFTPCPINTLDVNSVTDETVQTLTNDNKSQNGTIKGLVLLGPTCPVQRIPPDPACADKPYETVVQVIKIGSPQSSPLMVAKSDAQGQYEITLPAGEYSLQPGGGKSLPRCETKNITVKSGVTEEINLSCDTGIR